MTPRERLEEPFEFEQLANLDKLFEMTAHQGHNTITFAPNTLVDYAAVMRFVLSVARPSRP